MKKWCNWYGSYVEKNKTDGTEENCTYYGNCDTCDKVAERKAAMINEEFEEAVKEMEESWHYSKG